MNLQTFNDGILDIFKVDNIAEAGDMPKDGLILIVKGVRFMFRTVGYGRYFVAKTSGTKADHLIRIPRISLGNETDKLVCLYRGAQYEVMQVQYPTDAVPFSIDLTLERLGADYDFK